MTSNCLGYTFYQSLHLPLQGSEFGTENDFVSSRQKEDTCDNQLYSEENVAANAFSTGKLLSLIYSSRRCVTPNTAPTNGNVVVPEGIDIITV